jgi:hypothetical protein
VALGAVLPLPLDLLIGPVTSRFGDSGPFHALSTHVGLLILAMALTVGRRAIRKRLLALVIGGFGHLVLDAAWADAQSFGWPIVGRGSANRLQVWQRPILLSVLMEVVGIIVAMWLYRRCRLDRTDRRSSFLREGSLELLPVRRKLAR